MLIRSAIMSGTSVSDDPLELLHVDADCIVAIKPSGLLSVQGRGERGADSLAARVQAKYADALIVHRLDMSTSGLMLFARGADSQRTLSRAFASREVHKRYVAIVHGRVGQPAGEIDLPLIADWPNRPRQKVDHAIGKASLTRYRVMSTAVAPKEATPPTQRAMPAHATDTTRLELEPVTGRAHQLRVHLLAIGHPILGDALYAPEDVQARADRLLLHATSIGFAHPRTGEPMRFESTPPF